MRCFAMFWLLAAGSLTGCTYDPYSGTYVPASGYPYYGSGYRYPPPYPSPYGYQPAPYGAQQAPYGYQQGPYGAPPAYQYQPGGYQSAPAQSYGTPDAAAYPPPGGGRLEQRFAAANVTQDGRLTREQAIAGMPLVAENFYAIDVDNKGYVTLPEVGAFLAQHRAELGQQPGYGVQ